MRKAKAQHPSGEPVKGRFFVFVEEVKKVTYHTILVEAKDAYAAQEVALRHVQCGGSQAATVGSVMQSARVAPVRTGNTVKDEDFIR